MSWKNNDGLIRKFGTEQATSRVVGEYSADGPYHTAEITVDLTTLTETETILDYNFALPKGALIQELQVVATTSAATGTAIDVGLIKLVDKSTEYDYNGLLAAYPTASMAVGVFNRLSSGVGTYEGAVLGVALTESALISASRTTATAFTAGKVKIRINYFVSAF